MVSIVRFKHIYISYCYGYGGLWIASFIFYEIENQLTSKNLICFCLYNLQEDHLMMLYAWVARNV